LPWLNQLISDPDVLCSLELDELGLRMLPALASWPPHQTLTISDFVRTVVQKGGMPALQSHYPPARGAEIEAAIREAWAWLEGQALLVDDGRHHPAVVRVLSRRARQLAQEPDPRRALAARRIPKDGLHSAIREDVWSLYHRGKYDTAVFEAMKAVEVAVREAAELLPRDIGAPLMRKAFDVENGRLTDRTAEPAERQARSDLFAGAIGSYKNPHSHRRVALDDPDEAAEIIMLANHLLRIVDSRRTAGATS
jgi:uncharacterized protein (TIGR02391 family)